MDNILIITCIYPDPTDKHVGTFVANWAEQLKENGMDVMVYKRDHITFGSYLNFPRILKFYRSRRLYSYQWQGVPVVRQGIHLRLPLDYSKSAPVLTYNKIKSVIADIYEDFPFDLIYLATWGDLSLAMSWIAKEMGIPYVASAIGDHTTLHFDNPKSMYYKLERETYIGSEFVVCVSQDMSDKVKIMTDGEAKTLTFYSGVDVETFKPSVAKRNEYRNLLKYSEDEVVIAFAGRLTKEKGIYELLESFSRISRDISNVRLLLVGPMFEERKIKKTISQNGIQSIVTIIGGVGHKDIAGYMNAADLFVFPSWMEGLPNVVMEACASGLPVIASKVGGIPELIVDNVTGLLVSAHSVEDLIEKILFALSNPRVMETMKNEARKKMIDEFNFGRNGQYLTTLLKKVVDSNCL